MKPAAAGAPVDDAVVLRMRGIAKSYGRRAVLRGVDLDVARGETVAVLGPNGCGKSTLLRIAAGQSRPAAGTVQAAAVSYLGQEAPAYAELTAAEHVGWWAWLWDQPHEEAAVRGHLRDAGLLVHAHRAAGTFSRGERQRLALTLALLPDAPLLVLDEPFTGLDDVAHAWLESRLSARAAAGGSTLLALHGEETAGRIATRTLRLGGPA
jgi:ABC-type multidrug transport system ATPase subunit